MKHYLLQLTNGHYGILSSPIDYLVGDKHADGTIVQIGIQIREQGMHFNVVKRINSLDIIPISEFTFDDWEESPKEDLTSIADREEDR